MGKGAGAARCVVPVLDALNSSRAVVVVVVAPGVVVVVVVGSDDEVESRANPRLASKRRQRRCH